MDLAMDLWHSNNIKVIVRKFLKDDCLNTELLNYVDCTSFFVLILSVWLTIKPNNLKYCSQISKKHQTFIFAKGVLQSRACSSVHLSVCLSACLPASFSVCLSVRLWHIFLRISSVAILIFCMRIFCHIY